jgi:intracellular septation protein
MNSKLRLALDFGPLMVFFLAYRIGGLLTGTLALIAFTLAALVLTYMLEKRGAVMPLVSGIAVTVMGGLTLFLHDETFIKIKPTLVNLLFASILLVGLAMGRPLLKYLLSDALKLSDAGWKKLSLRWGIFFIFLAALNEIVWRHSSTDFWVNFKVFGMFTLTIVFSLTQIPLIQRYWQEPVPTDHTGV